MKLSFAFLTLFAASASARSLSPQAAAKVLRAARRLDQGGEGENNGENNNGENNNNNNNNNGNNNNNEEDEYAFLTKYNLKFVGCDASQQMLNDEGGYSYGAAFLRLCPSDSGCDSSTVGGCKEGYGDFAVAIEDFVDAYFEDQQDNMQWDDNFDGDKYAKCEQYEPEVEGDDNPYENYEFFIGAACTEDGEDIRLGFFSDDTCQTESSVSFGDVSNGWTLPYSSGGLVSKYCSDCLEYNEDEAAYGLRDMCTELYQNAPMKCEAKMEYFSYYGQDTSSCEAIDEILPRAARVGGGGAGKFFGWLLFVLLIVGVVGYVMWWRKKKQASGAADGMLA
ncbi:unnamed protein product [Cylindrotheca closterium]|uniref:Uncharacterized protein n=1 Tax=Cylindrotheca closterium TaxID=2856 RepID=A0AAD2G9H5_9STRA|nr:unnamed protein product [Cylindrotheca closterium]